MVGQRFHNLDALRGLCALTVVLFHCEGLFDKGEIFSHGFLAVDMFFVLSGFVIAHGYEARLGGGLSTGRFTWLRLKRLAPVYWVGTLLGAVMLATIAAYRPAGAFYAPGQIAGLSVMALALIPQLTLGGLAYPANPVAWSLLGELAANVAYARQLHALSSRALLGIAVAGWGVCAVIGYAGDLGWCFGANASDVLTAPLRAIPSFLVGVVLFRAHRTGRLARLPAVTPLLPLIVWVVIAEVPTFGPTPTFDLIVATLVCPALVALAVRAPQTAPRPLIWLGAISYPLYASHLSLVFLARNTPLFGFDRGPDPLKAALLVAAAIGLAWIIHVAVERRPAGAAARPAASVAPG
jgi:peptidoglycan/LPS O-acetylase OafA/YrhL